MPSVCNEKKELKVNDFSFSKRSNDEIVGPYDKEWWWDESLIKFNNTNKEGFWSFCSLENKLKDYCKGDYIFQIDADELPNEILIDNLPTILESNPNVDVYLVPRVNTVEGLTLDHQFKWRWNVNEKGWVNWPDYQWRVWKNKSEIKWVNKVHERLEGHREFATLPAEEVYALYHPKDIKRQEKQNAYYDTLWYIGLQVNLVQVRLP